MNYKVISFYQYTPLADANSLLDSIRIYCNENKILGRILLGSEGINGAVSGEANSITEFKLYLQIFFINLTFREQEVEDHAYHKLVIRIRNEICAFGQDVNLKNRGINLPPAKLKQWYDEQEDFMIIDARNDYEYELGHFKNAHKLDIKNFREFDSGIKKLNPPKDKKIVLYCTGGVRCEKASSYMKEQGYSNVYQVEGGVINYVNQYTNKDSNEDSNWEGGLFVFDDRLVSEIGSAITQCVHCKQESSKMIDCHNLACDKLVIVCAECQKKLENNCSEQCFRAEKHRPKKVVRRIVGKVENYYSKNEVALVKLVQSFKKQTEIIVFGKTTPEFKQLVPDLRDYSGMEIESACAGEYITFPVLQKVRKNDVVTI